MKDKARELELLSSLGYNSVKKEPTIYGKIVGGVVLMLEVSGEEFRLSLLFKGASGNSYFLYDSKKGYKMDFWVISGVEAALIFYATLTPSMAFGGSDNISNIAGVLIRDADYMEKSQNNTVKKVLEGYFDAIEGGQLGLADRIRGNLDFVLGYDYPLFVKADILIRRKRNMC